MLMAHAVVVTGIGLAIPMGLSVDEVWRRCAGGDSAVGLTTRFDPQDEPRLGAAVPAFDIAAVLRAPKNEKFMTPQVRHAVRAARDAAASAGLSLDKLDPYRIALYTGSGQTGLESADFFGNLEVASGPDESAEFANMGGRAARMLDRYWSLRTLSNAGLALISIELEAKGQSDNFTQDDTSSAAAVASGLHDLEEYRCDVAIVGGYDSLLTASNYLAYCRQGVLSSARPDRAYRPFDRSRDGLVLGEGAGFLVLERAEDAVRRNAPVLAELIGVASAIELEDVSHAKASSDALTHAIREASGAVRPDMVIAHGIGTQDDDRREAGLLSDAVGADVPITALKGATGYLGAATAAVELIIGLLAARAALVPPIARHEEADEGNGLSFVRHHPRALAADHPVVLTLSWSWFGHCAAIAARAVRPGTSTI